MKKLRLKIETKLICNIELDYTNCQKELIQSYKYFKQVKKNYSNGIML